MIVFVANTYGATMRRLQKEYPDKFGWIMGPKHYRPPWPGLQYVLDNDAFIAFKSGQPWNESAWLKMLDKATKLPHPPNWCLVPDVVGRRQETLENWDRYVWQVTMRKFTPAFAVQDGMDQLDVPKSPCVVFVGGSTQWKWTTVRMWAAMFPRVHVGRVRQGKLMLCKKLGVESCDGSGWFREGQTGTPIRFLEAYLSGHMQPHPEFAI